jgi:hypothetical protein
MRTKGITGMRYELEIVGNHVDPKGNAVPLKEKERLHKERDAALLRELIEENDDVDDIFTPAPGSTVFNSKNSRGQQGLSRDREA